jgi:soluble lytic murein transglycosylase-like protein
MRRAEVKGQKAKVRKELTPAINYSRLLASVSALRTFAFCLLPFALTLAWPVPASADLVRLTNGRVLSVESWQLKGEIAVMVLRGGGELQAPQSLIDEVLPDEYLHAKLQTLPEFVAPSSSTVNDLRSLIDRFANQYGVDLKLAHALIKVESNYEPRAVSPKGAMGLMQIMPLVAQQYAVDDPFDPVKNLDAGMRVLRALLDRFDVRTALAAYNAGLAAVARYGGIPPFRETQQYVQRIMALAKQ